MANKLKKLCEAALDDLAAISKESKKSKYGSTLYAIIVKMLITVETTEFTRLKRPCCHEHFFLNGLNKSL